MEVADAAPRLPSQSRVYSQLRSGLEWPKAPRVAPRIAWSLPKLVPARPRRHRAVQALCEPVHINSNISSHATRIRTAGAACGTDHPFCQRRILSSCPAKLVLQLAHQALGPHASLLSHPDHLLRLLYSKTALSGTWDAPLPGALPPGAPRCLC